MKPCSIIQLTWLTASLPLSGLAQVVITESYSFSSALTPADGTGAPASDTRTISGSAIASITDVNVHFTLTNPTQAGAYNGDYYVSLQHSSGFSVLLNRVGRRAGSSPSQTNGYGDNGFDVTFDDQAASGDIHLYRSTLGGSDSTPLDPNFLQPLTGAWVPDGRTTSPLSSLSTDTPSALLSVFNGLAANGTWTLQIVDFTGGGIATLTGWTVSLAGMPTAVPEPGETLAATGVALVALASLRRWYGRRAQS